MSVRLKSLQSFRNLEDFANKDISVWFVSNGGIAELVLGDVTQKMFYDGHRKLRQRERAYFSLEDAEVRFTRESLKFIKESGFDLLGMINKLQDIKERRPDLFL